jgi:hypothetical protein
MSGKGRFPQICRFAEPRTHAKRWAIEQGSNLNAAVKLLPSADEVCFNGRSKRRRQLSSPATERMEDPCPTDNV